MKSCFLLLWDAFYCVDWQLKHKCNKQEACVGNQKRVMIKYETKIFSMKFSNIKKLFRLSEMYASMFQLY